MQTTQQDTLETSTQRVEDDITAKLTETYETIAAAFADHYQNDELFRLSVQFIGIALLLAWAISSRLWKGANTLRKWATEQIKPAVAWIKPRAIAQWNQLKNQTPRVKAFLDQRNTLPQKVVAVRQSLNLQWQQLNTRMTESLKPKSSSKQK